jgi:hypothetical protein
VPVFLLTPPVPKSKTSVPIARNSHSSPQNISVKSPAISPTRYIIGERRVPNNEKVLSIYEPGTKVIVRGKSGAEVEYGNPLLLGENRDGLIVHWDLFEDVRSDSKLLLGALEATEETIGTKLKEVSADRGFGDERTREKVAT